MPRLAGQGHHGKMILGGKPDLTVSLEQLAWSVLMHIKADHLVDMLSFVKMQIGGSSLSHPPPATAGLARTASATKAGHLGW
jgi:hypothetical protein